MPTPLVPDLIIPGQQPTIPAAPLEPKTISEVLLLVERLSRALDLRAMAVAQAIAWYEGDHPIPEPPPNTHPATDIEARAAFDKMSRLGITNFLAPVVDVPASKLTLEGVQFSSDASRTNSEAGWRIFRRNHLVSDGRLANFTAVQTGQSAGIVWADSDGLAEITVEDPSQVIVAYFPGSRRRRAAALKRWLDDDGYTNCTLYLPNWVYKFISAQKSDSQLILAPTAELAAWLPRQPEGDNQWPLKNPLGEVNVVELRANALLKPLPFGGGAPQFIGQINDQRKINQTVLNMLITMEHQSFRQRWVVGWEAPKDADGKPDRAKMHQAAASLLWTFADEKTKVGEFSQADFSPFMKAIDTWVKVIASTSGTPPYAFLLGEMINVAADALARIEGIQANNRRVLQTDLGDGWLELNRLALKVESNPLANDPMATIVWPEAEERTATEQANLAQIMDGLGAPKEAVFAALPGVTQETAIKWARLAQARQLLEAAAADQNDPAGDPQLDPAPQPQLTA